jgi:PucR family transcriptional regulator, purine catabolism regulatory protein
LSTGIALSDDPAGARGQDWGRLIMVRGGAPDPRDVTLVERAATTLALGRLLEHERESLERQAHRTILGAFLGHGYASPAEAEARARALGMPVTGRRLLSVVIRLVSPARLPGALRPLRLAHRVNSPPR